MFNQENDMRKCAKEVKTQKKKDREEKGALKAEIEKLKVENTNLTKQLNDLEVYREDVKYPPKEEIKKVKEEVKNDIELAKTGWVDIVKRNIKKEIKDEILLTLALKKRNASCPTLVSLDSRKAHPPTKMHKHLGKC